MSTIERVREKSVEFGLYLPLGIYSKAREGIAELDRRRVTKLFDDLVERGHNRVGTVTRLRKQTERGIRKTETKVQRTIKSAATDVKATGRQAAAKATAAVDEVAPKLPRVAAPKRAGELPIPRYNDLTATDIVAEVRGLTQTELAKVYKFERANENRSTILDAVESKLIELPIATYDAMTVDEINERIESLSVDELKVIKRYESETKQRTTVLDKIESLLAK